MRVRWNYGSTNLDQTKNPERGNFTTFQNIVKLRIFHIFAQRKSHPLSFPAQSPLSSCFSQKLSHKYHVVILCHETGTFLGDNGIISPKRCTAGRQSVEYPYLVSFASIFSNSNSQWCFLTLVWRPPGIKSSEIEKRQRSVWDVIICLPSIVYRIYNPLWCNG